MNAEGLAGWGGSGMEIRLGVSLFLAPEIVYCNATMKASSVSLGTTFIGLQLTLVCY